MESSRISPRDALHLSQAMNALAKCRDDTEIGAQECFNALTIRFCAERVCVWFDVTMIDLVSERRSQSIARPRQIAMWLARKVTTRSLPKIGRFFGDRDHTTVVHAVRRIEALRETDLLIRAQTNALLRELGQLA